MDKEKEQVDMLYERLEWLTFYAAEDQVDVNEIQNIIELLDELDPMDMDSEEIDVEKALERFKERYGISDDDLKK